MSLCRSYSSIDLVREGPRKRTSSFSYPNQPSPRPTKVPRLTRQMSLRRTESFICLPDTTSTSTSTMTMTPTHTKKASSSARDQSRTVPYNRSLQYYKDQRQKQKAQLNRSVEPITIRIVPEPRSRLPTVRHTTPQPSKPATASPPTVGKPIVKLPVSVPSFFPRQSSPLAPTQSPLPGRPVFPRSKPEPDLYRKALISCLKRTPEGQQFLRMTKKLAASVMSATMDLERIVTAHTQKEKDPEKQSQDVVMKDAPLVLSKSWVVVSGDDWEMVDGTA